MDRGVYVAAGGAINQVRGLELNTANLSGGNVVGFKKGLPVFSIHPASYQKTFLMNGLPERAFSYIKEAVTDFSEGLLKTTGNALDVAISGEGFFVVETPIGERYTRKGDFIIGSDGKLKTKDGFNVLGENGVITLTGSNVSIASDGSITANGTRIDKLKVVEFANLSQLKREGNGLFAGAYQNIRTINENDVSILQGNLEMSNINAIREMISMINGLRAYESQMKAVKGFDDITDSAIKLAS